MRKLLTLFMAVIAITAGASQITPDEAATIASEFFNASPASRSAAKISVERVVPRLGTSTSTHSDSKSAEVQPLYIFNADNNNGFVIISGDKRTRQILGYSETGSFDTENVPPQLAWLLSQYVKSLEELPANAPAPRQTISRSAEHAPLLTTQWGQGEPYNAKCPVVAGTRAVTGCVATAMAQVVNYEKISRVVKEIPEYWCSVYMPTLPEHEFDLGNLDDDGIANLMLYCGQSVNMGYGATESGASPYDVPEALSKFFGWDPEVRLMDRSNYNDEHWNRMIKEEISAGHPIIYSAVSETGQGSHMFILDGFSDDLFHVNWGWEGYMDGYFSFQPFGQDHRSDYIKMQQMVSTRDDDYSADIITYGTTIDGINYELTDEFTAMVLPLKNGEKYSGDLVIPSHVDYEGNTYTVNYFGPNAFVNCKHLESIFIPASITGQEWSIFEGCENLHKVDIEDLTAFMKLEDVFWNSSPFYYFADLYINGERVTNLVIPEGTEQIGYAKFVRCTSIESVALPSSTKVIGGYAFTECPNLKHIDMSISPIERIRYGALMNLPVLEEITLPSTLKILEDGAIGGINGDGCPKLRKIVSLATTPPWSTDGNAFDERRYSDAVVYVPDEAIDKYRQAKEWKNFFNIRPLSEERPLPETAEVVSGGIIYEINLTENFAKIKGTEVGYVEGGFVIPESIEYNNGIYPVEEVGYGGLGGINIKQMNAPLKTLGYGAFGGSIFDECLTIPSTLKVISDEAFGEAIIPHLILPENISYIGKRGFNNEVQIIYFEPIITIESHSPNPPVICEDAFGPTTYNQTILKVPYGAKKAYASAIGWSNFKNIVNIGDRQEEDSDYDLTLVGSLNSNIESFRNRMPLPIVVSVRNSGLKSISGFTLSWFIDDRKLGDKHFEVVLGPNEVHDFSEQIITEVDFVGDHDLKLIVTIDEFTDQGPGDNVITIPFETFDKGYYRVSLIEQYTSELCAITPISTPNIFSGIENSGYSDFVTQVTHHCGFEDDFLTLNRDYEWFYNDPFTYTPAIMINRTDQYNTGYTPVSLIPNDVDYSIINESGFCDALVSVYCETKQDKLDIKVLLEKSEDFDLKAGYNYITVFLVEDNIPARAQKDPFSDGYIENYIHRNTVRKVLSKTWGDKIVWKDNMCALKFETEIDPEWNTKNLKAVAFIHRYDPTSPVNCQVYTANSSDLPQYGMDIDDELYELVDQSDPFDINGDGSVDVKDVVSLVDKIIHETADKAVHDLNGDGDVNVSDIVLLVNQILHGAAAQSTESRSRSSLEVPLVFDMSRACTAMQTDIVVSEGARIEDVMINSAIARSHSLSYREIEPGRYRVIVFSGGNQPMQLDEDEPLFTLAMTGDSRVTTEATVFVDTKLVPTSIDSVGEDAEVESITYFDLQGRQVSAAAKGILLERTVFSNGRISTRKIRK